MDNRASAENWMIDEMAPAGPEHLDQAFVAGCDRKQGYPDPAEDLAVFSANGLGAGSVRSSPRGFKIVRPPPLRVL